MALRLTIELSQRDLRHFRRELRRARSAVRIADDEEIVAAAGELVASLRNSALPDFVVARLGKLESMLAMVTDPDWKVPGADRAPVMAALAYLCDPDDLIPDGVPGIGLLDDAVMIELVSRELRHEIEAYDDFARYRKSLAGRAKGTGASSASAGKLEQRRRQLVTRMKRRRAMERRGAG
jgi:uncharacterized membrane protein YkvA (DUF1232 family)